MTVVCGALHEGVREHPDDRQFVIVNSTVEQTIETTTRSCRNSFIAV